MPKVHEMRLSPGPFERIGNGTKTLEFRLNDAKRKQVQVGDIIVFTRRDDPAQTLHVQVLERIEGRSFKYLFEKLGLANPTSMRDYYSAEDEARYGVVAFRIELIR